MPKRHEPLLDAVLSRRQEYVARVVIRGFGERGRTLWVSGEVQVTLPLGFYYEVMRRGATATGELVAGVDVNVDRISVAIVDSLGRLRDVRTFWFEEAGRKPVQRRRARSIIGMRVHEMLRYLASHSVGVVALENPGVLGKLKLL